MLSPACVLFSDQQADSQILRSAGRRPCLASCSVALRFPKGAVVSVARAPAHACLYVQPLSGDLLQQLGPALRQVSERLHDVVAHLDAVLRHSAAIQSSCRRASPAPVAQSAKLHMCMMQACTAA